MQPQTPGSPSPKYDFIMNSGQPPKKSWLPDLGLPRPAKIGLIVVLIIFAITVIAALIFGTKKSANQPLADLISQNQTIAFASSLAGQDSQDSDTQALATTVGLVMISQQKELSDFYVTPTQKKNGQTTGSGQDTALSNSFGIAVQNNNLEATYTNYLRSSLGLYAASLQKESAATSNAKFKANLNDDYLSVQTILDSLKT